MRNNQEQNGEVKEEKQEGADEEETYMAQNLTFAPPFMDGDAQNHPTNPSMNMEDDFLNNLWADGPAHTLTDAIGPPAAVAAQNGRVNEEWAESEMGVDNSEETLENFLQKAGVLPPGPTSNGPTVRPYGPPQVPLQWAEEIPPGPTPNGPTIRPYGPPQLPLQWAEATSNGPTIRPCGPPQVPLQRAGALLPGPAFQPYRPPPTPRLNLGPPNAEMAGRVGHINNGPTLNGPTVQPSYGPSRVPCTGPQNAQIGGHGPLPEARDLNLAGVGYGGQTIAAGNTSGVCYTYNGSIGVGFGGFTCDPMEVAGLRGGSSVVAAGPTEGMGGSGDRGKRLVCEPEEVVAERRTRRKVKNRESAARSRARKQAYVITMEAERDRLQGENSRLRLREQRLLKEKPEEAGSSTVRRCKSCSW